jgi:hypothetical protein
MHLLSKFDLENRLGTDLPKMHAELKEAQASHVFHGDGHKLARWALGWGPTLVASANQLLAYERPDLESRAITTDVS